MNNIVAIVKRDVYNYPEPPFNPPSNYIEFSEKIRYDIDSGNKVYDMVREAFKLLGLDKENIDTKHWNPFKNFVKPGDVVFIKPNMIAEKHELRNNEWDYVITHGSVIRPIIDYLYLAMDGKGNIIIGDSPQTDSNFKKIVELMGLEEIRSVYKNYKDFKIFLINLQNEFWIEKDGIITDYIKLSGDPLGNVLFDLGELSFFYELDQYNLKYYGASYDIEETNRAHSGGRHEYLVARSPLVADFFISIPKLKTHKKVGITLNLKGLVGISTNKNLLPHYTFGAPETGGDQFQKLDKVNKLENEITLFLKNKLKSKNPLFVFLARKGKKFAYKFFGDNKKFIRSGNWYGNDTAWRMCLDLAQILFYGNVDGSFRKNYSERKKFFSIVDGIVGMEGNGPVSGDRKECGVIIAGFDPVAVDAVGAKIMGFDPLKIKIISKAFDNHGLKITNLRYDEIECVSNSFNFNKKLLEFRYENSLKFKPHFGWMGYIEDKANLMR